jgi:hypothetical protein
VISDEATRIAFELAALPAASVAGLLVKLQISETIYPHDEGYAHGELVLAAMEDLERLAKGGAA